MDETPQDLADRIEASLNTTPFDPISVGGPRLDAPFLTGTCQFTLTGLASWLCTFKEGVHECVRCEAECDPPPDATLTCSPETYLRVVRREGGMDAQTAMNQGLVEVTGDWSIALAIVGESF